MASRVVDCPGIFLGEKNAQKTPLFSVTAMASSGGPVDRKLAIHPIDQEYVWAFFAGMRSWGAPRRPGLVKALTRAPLFTVQVGGPFCTSLPRSSTSGSAARASLRRYGGFRSTRTGRPGAACSLAPCRCQDPRLLELKKVRRRRKNAKNLYKHAPKASTMTLSPGGPGSRPDDAQSPDASAAASLRTRASVLAGGWAPCTRGLTLA